MELSNYINIFNKEFAGKLLFNYLKKHIIEINNKTLYINLFTIFPLRN